MNFKQFYDNWMERKDSTVEEFIAILSNSEEKDLEGVISFFEKMYSKKDFSICIDKLIEKSNGNYSEALNLLKDMNKKLGKCIVADHSRFILSI